MGLFDKFKGHKDKVQDLAREHGDKIAGGIDKAADIASDKTGGKYDTHIQKGVDAAKDGIDKLDGEPPAGDPRP
ncbi:antitoxin [Mumia zhuanghuii]|uniref:Antitoxin n=2 Tax=Mumia TaxID=1546255 RepID=A0ABW1QQC7_9ACTN|nr:MULTISPECIES: antitoxin [Mumia]KAA1420652.1 antitoxin [Mumia zhuanghuii]